MEQEEMEMVDDEDEEQQLEDEEQQWQEMNVLEMHAISIHVKLLDAAANDEDVDFEQCDGQQDHHQFDHRSLGRSARRKFRHDHARQCIIRDYLGTNALMGAEFKLMEDLGVLALLFLEPAGGVVGGLVVATMMMTAKNEFFVPAC